jgi:hypothetical protein
LSKAGTNFLIAFSRTGKIRELKYYGVINAAAWFLKLRIKHRLFLNFMDIITIVVSGIRTCRLYVRLLERWPALETATTFTSTIGFSFNFILPPIHSCPLRLKKVGTPDKVLIMWP